MDRLKCPHCGQVIGEGPGCEKCAHLAHKPDLLEMVQEGNARLARIERHLASMNGSLRNISVCLIVVASIFILGYIVSIVWGISSMQATMRNIDKQINIVQ